MALRTSSNGGSGRLHPPGGCPNLDFTRLENFTTSISKLPSEMRFSVEGSERRRQDDRSGIWNGWKVEKSWTSRQKKQGKNKRDFLEKTYHTSGLKKTKMEFV